MRCGGTKKEKIRPLRRSQRGETPSSIREMLYLRSGGDWRKLA